MPDAGATQLPPTCNPWKIRYFPADLSFSDRACMAATELASPGLLAETAMVAGLSQWRNNPHMHGNDTDDFGMRLAHSYARLTARITAETLVSYLHHEDLRPRVSGESNFLKRTRFAFLSVLESPDQNGHARIALAPLAGSLGSGFTSVALYQRQTSAGFALERSGIVYSHYFIRALYHEFRPELWSLAPHFARKYHHDDSPTN